jgi:nitric oxide reductase NorD protein
MLDFLELEETVGRAWHRLVGATATYPFHADRAVALSDMQGQIAVMFRALGGEAGVAVAGASSRKSGHRLGWRQRIGLGDESLAHPGRDAATIFLPERIALFPDRDLNAALYRRLAAWFATVPLAAIDETDPLRCDLLVLRRARATAAAVVARFPGLAGPYALLAAATASARPQRPLPRIEREVDQIVLALLGAAPPARGGLWSSMIGEKSLPERAPAGYRPVLPCPLWMAPALQGLI